MNLTQNFTLEELIASENAKRRNINNTPDQEQIKNLKRLCREILQPIRDRLQRPLIITSGFRSPELNKVVGGAKTSQHQDGEAADIVCYDNIRLWEIILDMLNKEEISVGQLIDEKDLRWIHISLPTKKIKNQILKIK